MVAFTVYFTLVVLCNKNTPPSVLFVSTSLHRLYHNVVLHLHLSGGSFLSLGGFDQFSLHKEDIQVGDNIHLVPGDDNHYNENAVKAIHGEIIMGRIMKGGSAGCTHMLQKISDLGVEYETAFIKFEVETLPHYEQTTVLIDDKYVADGDKTNNTSVQLGNLLKRSKLSFTPALLPVGELVNKTQALQSNNKRLGDKLSSNPSVMYCRGRN